MGGGVGIDGGVGQRRGLRDFGTAGLIKQKKQETERPGGGGGVEGQGGGVNAVISGLWLVVRKAENPVVSEQWPVVRKTGNEGTREQGKNGEQWSEGARERAWRMIGARIFIVDCVRILPLLNLDPLPLRKAKRHW